MKRLVVIAAASGLLLGTASPASAHSISSELRLVYPQMYNGSTWIFQSMHHILGCSNYGDGAKCSNGFQFQARAGAQIKLGGAWHDFGGTRASAVEFWPNTSWADATFELRCGRNDVGKTFEMRTRGQAAVFHGGAMQWTGWFYSVSRTEKCTRAAANRATTGIEETFEENVAPFPTTPEELTIVPLEPLAEPQDPSGLIPASGDGSWGWDVVTDGEE
jgi:hypothetical protein